MKIIDYKTLREFQDYILDELVRQRIKEGWQPLGGIALMGTMFVQTMVRYEEQLREAARWATVHDSEAENKILVDSLHKCQAAYGALEVDNMRLRETLEWACVTAADTALWRTELRRRMGLDEADNNRLREGKAT